MKNYTLIIIYIFLLSKAIFIAPSSIEKSVTEKDLLEMGAPLAFKLLMKNDPGRALPFLYNYGNNLDPLTKKHYVIELLTNTLGDTKELEKVYNTIFCQLVDLLSYDEIKELIDPIGEIYIKTNAQMSKQLNDQVKRNKQIIDDRYNYFKNRTGTIESFRRILEELHNDEQEVTFADKIARLEKLIQDQQNVKDPSLALHNLIVLKVLMKKQEIKPYIQDDLEALINLARIKIIKKTYTGIFRLLPDLKQFAQEYLKKPHTDQNLKKELQEILEAELKAEENDKAIKELLMQIHMTSINQAQLKQIGLKKNLKKEFDEIILKTNDSKMLIEQLNKFLHKIQELAF